MKIYKNKKTKYHPSIKITSNENTWKNLELTQNPTENNRYIELKKNPNPKSNKKSYVRKYIRNDPIRTRGELMEKYKLSEEDLQTIENFILEHENKKS